MDRHPVTSRRHRRQRAREAARERQQRWRDRQASGIAIYPVPVSGCQIDGLIHLGNLLEREATDPTKIVAAICLILSDLENTS